MHEKIIYMKVVISEICCGFVAGYNPLGGKAELHTVIPKGKFSCWHLIFYSAADQSILQGRYIYILSFATAAWLAVCGVLF